MDTSTRSAAMSGRGARSQTPQPRCTQTRPRRYLAALAAALIVALAGPAAAGAYTPPTVGYESCNDGMVCWVSAATYPAPLGDPVGWLVNVGSLSTTITSAQVTLDGRPVLHTGIRNVLDINDIDTTWRGVTGVLDLTQYSDGVHTLVMTATDSTGATYTDTDQVGIQNEPAGSVSDLTATLTSQPAGWPTTWSLAWTLPSGDVAPYYQLDYSTTEPTCADPNPPVVGDLPLMPDGTNSIPWVREPQGTTIYVWLTDWTLTSDPMTAVAITLGSGQPGVPVYPGGASCPPPTTGSDSTGSGTTGSGDGTTNSTSSGSNGATSTGDGISSTGDGISSTGSGTASTGDGSTNSGTSAAPHGVLAIGRPHVRDGLLAVRITTASAGALTATATSPHRRARVSITRAHGGDELSALLHPGRWTITIRYTALSGRTATYALQVRA